MQCYIFGSAVDSEQGLYVFKGLNFRAFLGTVTKFS